MSHISLSKIKPADAHGQIHCTVKTTIKINDVPPGVYENYVVDPRDEHGLAPVVRAVLLTGKKSYNFPEEKS